MSGTTDFSSLLNTKAEDIKELPVLPQGQYAGQIGQFEFKNVKTKDGAERPVIIVPIKLTSAIQVAGDVPPRLPEQRSTFWLTNNEGVQDEYTLNPLKVFLEAAGVDMSGDMTPAVALTQINGAQIVVDIAHSPNPNNPSRPYANIKSYAKA